MLYEDVKFDKHSKFLVTGGAGFIGSSIIEKLVQENYYVRCLDDLSNGFIENMSSMSFIYRITVSASSLASCPPSAP